MMWRLPPTRVAYPPPGDQKPPFRFPPLAAFPARCQHPKMARWSLLLMLGIIALFVALLLLRWPPAWDALFGLAYWLDGYRSHGG
jgi:hypothetical protein